MDRITLLHSPVQLSDNLPTANLYNLHRVTGMATIRMEYFHKPKLPMRLQHLRVDVVFVTAQTHQVYQLACRILAHKGLEYCLHLIQP